jgi:hypothetical protein
LTSAVDVQSAARNVYEHLGPAQPEASLDAAGFRVTGVMPMATPFFMVEAVVAWRPSTSAPAREVNVRS